MEFTPTAIPEIILIKPQVFGDDRGFFYGGLPFRTIR